MTYFPQMRSHAKRRIRPLLIATLLTCLLIAMFFGTKIVSINDNDGVDGHFDAAAFASEKWHSEVLPGLLANAVPLLTVVTAIASDPVAAAEELGVTEGLSAPVFTVTFTGVARAIDAGVMSVDVEGLPGDASVRVQMGPAIYGTALRDGSGKVRFNQFTNQIDYQDVGTELNEIIKREVLAGLEYADIPGRTLTVTGAFQLVNPESFLVTPVAVSVEQ